MYFYKVYTKNGIEYVETREKLNSENAIPLTVDEYYDILEQLIAESASAGSLDYGHTYFYYERTSC